MKALTLHQPWATLIARGLKTIETRSWPTSYRGPLAIHAGRRWDDELAEICGGWPIGDYISLDERGAIDDGRLRGCIVAIANLAACRVMTTDGCKKREEAYERWADCCEYTGSEEVDQMARDYAFGFWEPGRYAWCLTDIRPVEPAPARGRQGLWDWDEVGLTTRLGVPA